MSTGGAARASGTAVHRIACLLLWICTHTSGAAAQPDYPAVTLDYKPMFDASCAASSQQEIEPEAVKELQARLEEFREFWRKEAPRLLGAVPGVAGAPYRFNEARAALSLCPSFPSMSLPLLINMRMYLSATSKGAPTPLVDFSNNVMHEVLHRYVSEAVEALPGGSTPLLNKYSDEPPAVRNHLHLYAIIWSVYAKLGRERDLEVVLAAEKMFPRAWAISQRAREIVAKEGGERFLAELRQAAPTEPRANSAAMSQAEFRALLQRLADGWNENDARKAAECFTEDAVYTEPPDKQEYRGRPRLYEFFGGDEGRKEPMQMTWRHVAFDAERQIGMGEFTFEYGSKAHGVAVIRVRDGRIANWREYYYESDLSWEAFMKKNPF